MLITKKIVDKSDLFLYADEKPFYKKRLNTSESEIYDLAIYEKYFGRNYSELKVQDSRQYFRVEANIRFKTTDEGGRISGIKSGYRPNHVFEYNDSSDFKEAFMGDINFQSGGFLELGKEYQTVIRFPLRQRIEKFLDLRRKWWIHEGPRQVGEAQMIRISIDSF